MESVNSGELNSMKRLKLRIESAVVALDETAIRWHLRHTERKLRATDITSLDAAAQKARARTLDALNDYWKRYDLPRNDQHAQRIPIFIDAEGRACAVAHLLIEAGQATLAQHVAQVANTAYVPEMTFPELARWAQSNGVTVEELARIQPTYPPIDPVTYYKVLDAATRIIAIGLVASAIGVITLPVNIVQMIRKRIGKIAAIVGLAVGTASIAASLLMVGANTQIRALVEFDHPFAGDSFFLRLIYDFNLAVAGNIRLIGILVIVLGALRLFVNVRLKRRSQSEPDVATE